MENAAARRLAGRGLARVNAGKSLSVPEAAALLETSGEQQFDLIQAAGRVRDLRLGHLGEPKVVTYSPKVFIPLTRLCRDRCHYCAFARTPAQLARDGCAPFLDLDDVLAIARAGVAAGCAEALFTLGDRPEERWLAAREWLSGHGHSSTASYLREAAGLVFRETGLLPHLNPGVLTWEELAWLRPVSASMGLMLETSAERLGAARGTPHFGSPDKEPAVRLRTISDAGRLSIPFTTGILVGIGESPTELVESLLAIRRTAREFGHIQEVIVQNFRSKDATPMASRADLGMDALVNAVAVARILLGPSVALQAPPNLADPGVLLRLLAAGVDDWGGISPVTADHVNPERPWPSVGELARQTSRAGFELRPRLAAHPRFVADAARWLPDEVAHHVERIADRDGLLANSALPVGPPRRRPPRYDALAHDAGRGAGGEMSGAAAVVPTETASRRRIDRPAAVTMSASVKAALRMAEASPGTLAAEDNADLALALMTASGPALDVLTGIADDLRRGRVGDDVTYVVNRNINFTNVCYQGCRFCAFAQRATDPEAVTLTLEQVGEKVREAVAVGATEICMQGGIHPGLDGNAYLELIDAVKGAEPGVHLHAFSPMEIHTGATRAGVTVTDWLGEARARGLDSIPGTAAEILDEAVRRELTLGKLPASTWIDVITSAHAAGIPTTSTMMYGHVDQPKHWVDHLRVLRRIQLDTGGFTEFVGLPFIHENAPIFLSGRARPGPTARDDTAVTAMARILLDGAIDNIQVSWVKLGPGRCAELLQAGANDLGGTLMEETISNSAGSLHGTHLDVDGLRAIAALTGRPSRQRTTTYGPVPGLGGQAVDLRRVSRSAHNLW